MSDLSLCKTDLSLIYSSLLINPFCSFFREMSLFFWILTPSLHTPSFIRSISPFLATALAATAAQFCPFSGHLTRGLEAHARYLSTRIFMEGLKSIEIVQGYLFLACVSIVCCNTRFYLRLLHTRHWISPTEYCIRDESWSLTGIALFVVAVHSRPLNH